MSNKSNVPRSYSLIVVCQWITAVLFSFTAGKLLEKGADFAWLFLAVAVLFTVAAILFTFRGHRPKSE